MYVHPYMPAIQHRRHLVFSVVPFFMALVIITLMNFAILMAPNKAHNGSGMGRDETRRGVERRGVARHWQPVRSEQSGVLSLRMRILWHPPPPIAPPFPLQLPHPR